MHFAPSVSFTLAALLPLSLPSLDQLVWPQPHTMTPSLPSPSFVPLGSLVMRLELITNQPMSRCNKTQGYQAAETLIVDAFNRFATRKLMKCSDGGGETLIHIKTHLHSSGYLLPQHLQGINESYTLLISSSQLIQMEAPSLVGILHAFETLSQLIPAQKQCLVAAVSIQDQPRFPHRGLMLDTARNFFTVKDIQRQLDGMAASKLNVFHWHIYDSQSFPIAWEFDGGKLYKQGAYRTRSTLNTTQTQLKVYTQQDVQNIVDYAFMRGIRVIPEFDMPGHTTVFGTAYPDIIKCMNASPFDGGKGQQNFITRKCNQPPCGQFDPSSEKMYSLVNQFLSDMSLWFPDPVLHVGMDEVNPMCWDQPRNDLNLITEPMVLFSRRIVDMLNKNNKRMMVWDEAVASYNLSNSKALHGQNVLPNNAMIQVWESISNGNIRAQDAGVPLTGDGVQDMVQVISSLGYPVIVSPSNAWYLDCSPQQTWCASKDNQGNSVWHNWTVMYDYEPTQGLQNPEAVQGGETAAWSETIKGNNLDFMIWPRAAAVAEKLWSPKQATQTRTRETESRLNRFRAALVNELELACSSLNERRGMLEETFYRVEWCDFNLDSPAQKSSDIYPGMEKEPEKVLSDYCAIASKYTTERLVYKRPSRVAYPY